MTAGEFKAWKKRRWLTNADIAKMIGLSESAIDKKLNGRTRISRRLPIELANIDRIIALGGFPENCPEKLRIAIIERRVR